MNWEALGTGLGGAVGAGLLWAGRKAVQKYVKNKKVKSVVNMLDEALTGNSDNVPPEVVEMLETLKKAQRDAVMAEIQAKAAAAKFKPPLRGKR